MSSFSASIIIKRLGNARIFLICFVFCICSANADDNKQSNPTANSDDRSKIDIEFGVFPQLSRGHFDDAYTAIAERLTEATDAIVHYRKNENMRYFFKNLAQQQYDIVFIQPFEYIKLADKFGYRPLVAQIEPLSALIVVKKKRALQHIQNLLGRKLLLPEKSNAISYLTKKHLSDFGFDLNRDILMQHERSHITCLQKLLLGFSDACATVQTALNFFEQKMEVKFRVITESTSIPNILIAAHPRVQQKIGNQLIEVFVNLQKYEKGQKILKLAQLLPFRTVTDHDYDVVRKIKNQIDRQ